MAETMRYGDAAWKALPIPQRPSFYELAKGETFEGQPVWEGVVHVIDLDGHPTATRAYAWSSSIEGSTKRRFFAVLHIPPIVSPLDAVRAAIVAEHRGS